ncbi:MAG: nitroreductase family deazaflavin-dependent oxidoreductase [Actinomycetota bacterium]
MGVQTALGYQHKAGNPFSRAMRSMAGSKPGAVVFSKTIQPIDGAVQKLTGNTKTATELLAGLPVVYLTTVGRKSGQSRRTPLIAVPIGDDLALLGTNFGGKRTPGWVFNLEADPNVTVGYGTTEINVVARPATDDEFEAVFAAGGSIYGGYTKYRERVDGRDIRVFVLEQV